MNYLLEINRFYSWLTTHPQSPQAQALWNMLMSIDNRAGWPKEFAVSSATLSAALGISRTQLSRCRKELIDAGRIVHAQQKGGQAALYSIVSFEAAKVVVAESAVTKSNPPSVDEENEKCRRKRLAADSPHRLNRAKLHLVR